MQILPRRNEFPAERTKKKREVRRGLLGFLLPSLLIAGAIHVFADLESESSFAAQTAVVGSETKRDNDVITAYVEVLDKAGNPVTDLKREEFSVKEEGVAQEIVEVGSATRTPLLIGVMVDMSGSTRADTTRSEKMRILAGFFAKVIQNSDEAFVSGFGQRAVNLTGFTNNLGELQAALKEIANESPIGSTALYDALFSTAKTMEKEPGRRKVILVMSDFEDNTSNNSLGKTVLRMEEAGITVFPLIGIGPEQRNTRGMKQGLGSAKELAVQSGGAVCVFEKPQGLESSLERIRTALRNSYAVKYRSGARAKKGKNIAVKIEVLRKDVEVMAARGRAGDER